ncbi:hypothetical protein J7E99_14560 [Streptomyces sp. ISL-44]|uniref:hypothetical protein n=1 Tax=Streptomyces sp. ISL-44 TaxID=2819184 RepID=UPI001BE69B20|nr:hypothetical protein [Streptomyces sp. ISL-44]MBT2541895.1 hypothetical protein [Streptomyces sp. ISL-44]
MYRGDAERGEAGGHPKGPQPREDRAETVLGLIRRWGPSSRSRSSIARDSRLWNTSTCPGVSTSVVPSVVSSRWCSVIGIEARWVSWSYVMSLWFGVA